MFGRNVTLKLTGNSWLRGVQRLDDKDILALSKCLRNSKCVTGEQSGLGDHLNKDFLFFNQFKPVWHQQVLMLATIT